MATVNELINQLQQIGNRDQTVIFQYFIAEDFELCDTDENQTPTAEQFDKAAEDLDHHTLWDDAAETINDYLCGLMLAERDDD